MALPPPPAGLDLTETRVPEIVGALVSTWFLAAGALGLRVFARRLRGGDFWWDDYLAFAAFVVAGIHVWVSVGYMVPHGTGKHIWAGPPEAAMVWAIGLFVSEIVYTLTLCLVKYSTLCLYWRVFGTSKRNRIPIWILAGLVTAWGVAILLTSIFQCVPTRSWWKRLDPVDPMPPTEFVCGVDSTQFFIGNSIPTIVTDIMMIAMPVPYIWSLQMRVPQKIGVLAIFLLGAFVTIISMVRLSYLLHLDLQSPDITWNFVVAVIWTNLEGNIAIICCCLPTLKPILNLVMEGSAATRLGSRKNTYGSGANNSNHLETIGGTGASSNKHHNIAQDDLELQSGPGGYLDADKLPTTVRDGETQRPFAWLDDKSAKSDDYDAGSMGAFQEEKEKEQEQQQHQRQRSSSNKSAVVAGHRPVGQGRGRGGSRPRNDRRSTDGGSSTDELASPASLGGITVTHEVAVQRSAGSGVDLKSRSVVPF
ncbi:hypothetical protein MCOR16_010269 [Pyricularia oryzae]|nr:hypothetical protein MCOR15_004549 [Pyricularia oryzae]KAI6515170.1 hypothetical protein MCOR16_010269 [Pyricularia oryzae]